MILQITVIICALYWVCLTNCTVLNVSKIIIKSQQQMARLSSVLQPVLQSVYHHNALLYPGAVGHLLVQNYSFDFDLVEEAFDLLWPFGQKITVCRFVKVKTVKLHALSCSKTLFNDSWACSNDTCGQVDRIICINLILTLIKQVHS